MKNKVEPLKGSTEEPLTPFVKNKLPVIVNDIRQQIKRCFEDDIDGDDKSWGMQEGVLLSMREAAILLAVVEASPLEPLHETPTDAEIAFEIEAQVGEMELHERELFEKGMKRMAKWMLEFYKEKHG